MAAYPPVADYVRDCASKRSSHVVWRRSREQPAFILHAPSSSGACKSRMWLKMAPSKMISGHWYDFVAAEQPDFVAELSRAALPIVQCSPRNAHVPEKKEGTLRKHPARMSQGGFPQLHVRQHALSSLHA